MLTTALNPAVITATPAPATAPATAAPTSSREPGAFGRELQRAADRAQAEEAPQQAGDSTGDTSASERPAPAPRSSAGTRSATNKAERGARAEGKASADDTGEVTALVTSNVEAAVDDKVTEVMADAGEGRPEIAAWLQQWAQQRDPGAHGRAAAAATPGAGRRAERAAEALAPARDEPAAATAADLLTGQPAIPGEKARTSVQTLAVAAGGTPAATTQSLQALQSAGAEAHASFAAQLDEAAQAVQTEAVRVEPTAAPVAGPGAARPAAAEPTAATSVAEDRLTPPVGSREFAQALGARVAVFARNGIEQARLQVNPAEMGPIALQLALDGTQLRVDMVAEMAATRQMLEQALPTLASSLREAGLTLTGGGVFQQARDGGAETRQGQDRSATDVGTDATGPLEAVPAARTVRIDGLVDTYA